MTCWLWAHTRKLGRRGADLSRRYLDQPAITTWRSWIWWQPRLTTIRIDLGQMGRGRGRIAARAHSRPRPHWCGIFFSEPELVIRASTAPPKPAALGFRLDRGTAKWPAPSRRRSGAVPPEKRPPFFLGIAEKSGTVTAKLPNISPAASRKGHRDRHPLRRALRARGGVAGVADLLQLRPAIAFGLKALPSAGEGSARRINGGNFGLAQVGQQNPAPWHPHANGPSRLISTT